MVTWSDHCTEIVDTVSIPIVRWPTSVTRKQKGNYTQTKATAR